MFTFNCNFIMPSVMEKKRKTKLKHILFLIQYVLSNMIIRTLKITKILIEKIAVFPYNILKNNYAITTYYTTMWIYIMK